MAAVFRKLANNVPGPCDVLITTDTELKRAVIQGAFQGWQKGNVEIRLVANRGRDIAPKLTAFREEYSSYDLILFLHSKKTEMAALGAQWRDEMFMQLCGSPEIVRSIQYLFAADSSLGIVCCRHFPAIRPYLHWRDNEVCGKFIAEKLGLCLDVDGVLDFPSGSFFWARPGALKPLLDLGLEAMDFPPEAGQLRGTIAHAIERLFLLVCEQAGYSWCKVGWREFVIDGEALITVEDRSHLESARRAAHFTVSDTMLQLVDRENRR